MGPPPSTQVPDTMAALGELDLRREVHVLRAEVQALRAHAVHTTEVHNTFAGDTITTVDQILARPTGDDA